MSDYLNGWDKGFASGYRQGVIAERKAAFAAIRRAAAYAKHADREGSYDTAADIRRAIRAAIGSVNR